MTKTNQGREEKTKIFLDSSILVSATLSSSGGSFRLLRESNQDMIQSFTNQYVIDEVNGVLQEKYPQTIIRFHKLLEWSSIKVMANPSSKIVAEHSTLIHPEDAPILAGAIISKVDFLITLDKKHFMTKKLQNMNLPFIIVAPKDFFQR